VDYVEELAGNMHIYSPEHVVNGLDLLFEYDPAAIEAFVAQLTPDRCRIDVLAKEFGAHSELMTTSWFKAQYYREPVPADYMARWLGLGAEKPEPLLHLPMPNSFIPTDFELKPEPEPPLSQGDAKKPRKSSRSKKGATAPAAGPVVKTPTMLIQEKEGSLWHLLDTTFQLPRGRIHCLLESPACIESTKGSACNLLLTALLVDCLAEDTYPAALCELYYGVNALRKGMEFTVHGFHGKMLRLLEVVTSRLAAFAAGTDTAAAERLPAIKELYLKELRCDYYKPSRQAGYCRFLMKMDKKFIVEEVEAEAEKLTVEDLQKFAASFLANMNVVMFVVGNQSAQDAKEAWTCVRRVFPSRALAAPNDASRRVFRVPEGALYQIRRSRNPSEPNSAIVNYYEIGEGTMDVQCKVKFLQHLMWEPCFDRLRTKEQLGYSVGLYSNNGGNLFGIVVSAQGDRLSPKMMDWRIEKFLQWYRVKLDKMSPESFERFKQGLLDEMGRPDNNLSERSARFWDEIYEADFNFKRLEQQLASIKALKKGDLITFFDRFLLARVPVKRAKKGGEDWAWNPRRRKLSTCVHGTGYLAQANDNAEESSSSAASSVVIDTVAETDHANAMWFPSSNPMAEEVIDAAAIARFQLNKTKKMVKRDGGGGDDEGDDDEGDESDEGDDMSDEGDDGESKKEKEEEEEEENDECDMDSLQPPDSRSYITSHAELLAYKANAEAYIAVQGDASPHMAR
jgi:nardilysin